MKRAKSFFTMLTALLTYPLLGYAQLAPTAASTHRQIRLNVEVSQKGGIPVAGLTLQDFTVLDNKTAQPITSFKMVRAGQEPVELILFLDEMNADYNTAALQRDGVERFLRAYGKKLPYPTSIALLTDVGAKIQPSYSTDGNAMADALAHTGIDRRIVRVGTQFGEFDRVHMSLTALHQFLHIAAHLPGRKIVLFISPGWPLLADSFRTVDPQMEKQIFEEAEYFSTMLRDTNVTLYHIDPTAVREMRETAYYQAYLAGLSKPSQAYVGNLALQVLATRSGGEVLESSTSVRSMIQQCLSDLQSWYELSFDAPANSATNVYHQIRIKLDKSRLAVRTSAGYYANPTVGEQE